MALKHIAPQDIVRPRGLAVRVVSPNGLFFVLYFIEGAAFQIK